VARYERSAFNVQSRTYGGDYISWVGTQRPLDRAALAAAFFDADRL